MLLLVGVLGTANYQPSPTRPTSVEAGANGYRALRDWLHDSGIEVASHRDRFDDLAERYGTGNLLVSTLPYRTRIRQDEIDELRWWVWYGNTLLLLVALNDTPDWSRGVKAGVVLNDLAAISGLRFETVEGESEADENDALLDALQPQRAVELRPIAAHPLAAGLRSLVGETDYRSDIWRIKSGERALRLRIAVTERQGTDALWHLPHGHGRILLASLGSLFVNRNIGKADNAVFVANVVRHHLAPGKTVIFDDLHQGLSNLYDPNAFFKDRRLHASIAFALALWFVYMVGTWNRLAPPRQRADAPGQEGFVYAVGGFFARKLAPVEAGRRLFEFFFIELTGRNSRFEQPPWARFDANPAIDKALLADVKADYARLSAGQRVDLRRLRNRLRQLGGNATSEAMRPAR